MDMVNKLDLSKILFLDIETVPQYADFTLLDPVLQQLWDEKTRYQRGESVSAPDFYTQRAGVLAEFAKIICISVGFMHSYGGTRVFKIKSFYGDDEKILLEEFAALLNSHYSRNDQLLCAHNGKEFDFPVICRRLLINGIRIPDILDIAGKKPWEIQHLDTMELWKFGDYKNYTSLKLLAAIFGIPTPKDDIDGSEVAHVYWNGKDLERIVAYCQKDTLTVAQLLLRYRGEPVLRPEDIEIVS